ncbi:MAG: ribonuclease R [Hyphomicrobiaceae bacterium]|nr:ribonuclease R [Hyphomicrobiaceae bacterium]
MARKPGKHIGKRTAVKPRSGGARAGSGHRETPHREAGQLPTKDAILQFIATADQKVGKREIAQAFGIKGGAKIGLKKLLAEMAGEGTLIGNRREMHEPGSVPPVAVLEVTGRDDDGDLIGKPAVWDLADGERPSVLILAREKPLGSDEPPIGVGDKVLARVTKLDEADVEGFRFEAVPIKRLPREKRRMLGIYREHPRGGGVIEPIDRKELKAWSILKGDEGEAKSGDLVRYDLNKKGRMSIPQARVVETLGNPDDQRKISLIAIHAHGIPDDFPESVIEESERLTPPTMEGGRVDLRGVQLLTIDPPDARDHDDAVHAEADSDARNPGGFIVTVAIADVAYFVRPGSRLDREAQLRGNSVYFPDRVVPMLPERISNDLCSLREGEDRACLAVRMIFDKTGEKRGHTFLRAMMRSAVKLSYQEAQAAIDGNPSEKALPFLESALRPLWAAYAALAAARDRREPLDLDLPERKILLDKQGRVDRVVVPERLAAHRLIEEMMIQANVAAAQMLEKKKTPVVYRIHDQPSKEKLKSLKDFLETLDMAVPHAGELKAGAFNRVLEKAKSTTTPDLINEVVLRSQAQAEYNIANIGHFGLNLAKYAHFTSPIRRYADLLVHRALVRALELGAGGLTDEEKPTLGDVARQISEAERRAMAAERETTDRLIATHLADKVGATFMGRIAGVTRSGLFVKLKDTGADGFVPISTLGNDYFNHVEEARALVGSRTGQAYRLGDDVEVKLVEAVPTAGALRFEMLTVGKHGPLAAGNKRGPGPKRFGRGQRRR